MGDFILYHKDRLPETKIRAALSALAAQGSEKAILAAHDSYVIHFFPKQLSPVQNFITDNHGNFCGSSGSLIYKGRMGGEALKNLLDDFTPDHYKPEDFSGIFTVIIRKGDRLYLLTDPMGGNRVYENEGKSFWSSSFLATAKASDRLSPNKQAIYEYAFQETTYGTDTVFKEVNCLDALKNFEFTPDGPVANSKNLIFDFQPSPTAQNDLVQETAQMLRQIVMPISQRFGDRITTALSGGYDSRLMLALLQDSGSSPHVYVYGPDDSPDVTVARTIARGENFPLDHVNKAAHPIPTAETYPDIIRDNFHALDGLPGETIFDFGANMATRRNRAGDGYMVFNGGGGEIFRNFFYLPDKSFTITDLINCFYCRYTTTICGQEFNETNYRDSLHDKIKTALEASSDKLTRGQIEYAYPAFRLRYWTARDNNNNTRLGSYLTPFVSYQMIRKALTIPLEYKNHGGFQADLIKAISPRLAAYPSDYGYAFDDQIPGKTRFKNILNYYRPTCLRRYSYAIQHRMRDLTLPATLESIFREGTPHMSPYFKIDKIRDVALLGRVYTLEYLFNHFGI